MREEFKAHGRKKHSARVPTTYTVVLSALFSLISESFYVFLQQLLNFDHLSMATYRGCQRLFSHCRLSHIIRLIRIKDGCDMRPLNASVAAKQASKMLALVWSLGLLFTAIITNTLSRNVKGQVMLLMMVVMV